MERIPNEGLLDITLQYNLETFGESETEKIELGCQMELPEPSGISVVKKLQIELELGML